MSIIVIVGLDAFPNIPTSEVINNLTFRIFHLVPFKYGRPYGLAEPRDVKYFSKSKRSCAPVDMRGNELRDYRYTLCYKCKVNQISLVSVRNLDKGSVAVDSHRSSRHSLTKTAVSSATDGSVV